MPDVDARIRRLYTAVGATYEEDRASIAPKVTSQGGLLWTSFGRDLSEDQIANLALAAIERVAHLMPIMFRTHHCATMLVRACVAASAAARSLPDGRDCYPCPRTVL